METKKAISVWQFSINGTSQNSSECTGRRWCDFSLCCNFSFPRFAHSFLTQKPQWQREVTVQPWKVNESKGFPRTWMSFIKSELAMSHWYLICNSIFSESYLTFCQTSDRKPINSTNPSWLVTLVNYASDTGTEGTKSWQKGRLSWPHSSWVAAFEPSITLFHVSRDQRL